MLSAFFMIWALIDARRKGFQFVVPGLRYSLREKMQTLPRVLPLLAIIVGMMFVLYGGVATPSEAAGAGAMLTLIVVILVYRLFRARDFVPIFGSAMRESVMIIDRKSTRLNSSHVAIS